MDGVSFFMEELEVFLEGSDVLYGTFFSTVVLYGHSEIIHDSFFFFKNIITALILSQIIFIWFPIGSLGEPNI